MTTDTVESDSGLDMDPVVGKSHRRKRRRSQKTIMKSKRRRLKKFLAPALTLLVFVLVGSLFAILFSGMLGGGVRLK